MTRLLELAVVGAVTSALVFGLAPSPDAQARGIERAKATVNLVHGIPGADDFPVDIYIVNNRKRQTLEGVTFGTAAALEARAGWVYVAVLPEGSIGNGKFDKPILQKFFRIKRNQIKTVAAYQAADADGRRLCERCRANHRSLQERAEGVFEGPRRHLRRGDYGSERPEQRALRRRIGWAHPNTSAQAFAVGTFPETLTVVPLLNG